VLPYALARPALRAELSEQDASAPERRMLEHVVNRVRLWRDVELSYGRLLVDDVLNRTETAMSQTHCFLAMELALRAQRQAQRVA
jgi:hypothetical protein